MFVNIKNMNNNSNDPKQESKAPPPPPPGPKHNELPPHILHEMFDLQRRVGKLEGMLEVLLKQK